MGFQCIKWNLKYLQALRYLRVLRIELTPKSMVMYFLMIVLQKALSFNIITKELCMLGRPSSVQTNFLCLLLKPCKQGGLFRLGNGLTKLPSINPVLSSPAGGTFFSKKKKSYYYTINRVKELLIHQDFDPIFIEYSEKRLTTKQAIIRLVR